MLLFEGDIQGWGIEFLIIGVALLLIVLLAVLMFKPKKNAKAVENKQEVKKEQPAMKVQEETVVKTPVEQKTDAPMMKKTEVKKEVVEPKEEKVVSSAKVQSAEVEEDEDDEDSNNPDKPKRPAKYHISQNKDTEAEHAGEWRVRKEGSTKTIKFFKTQKEAIAYAERLAENQDSSIVIHKRDGTIRKQDYTKK